MLATVLPLAAPLLLVPVAGCGDSTPVGGTVKEDARPQEGIDNMKKFMEQQKGAAKK